MPEPFHISPSITPSPMGQSLWRAARPRMEAAMGLPSLNRLYTQIAEAGQKNHHHFADNALEVMPLTLDFNEQALEAVPKQGPLVVVANHPFGGIEGVILASLIRRVRPDVKLLANEMLACIPELRGTFFFVDVFGEGGSARRRNATPRRGAARSDGVGGRATRWACSPRARCRTSPLSTAASLTRRGAPPPRCQTKRATPRSAPPNRPPRSPAKSRRRWRNTATTGQTACGKRGAAATTGRRGWSIRW